MQHDLVLIGTGKLARNLLIRLAGFENIQLYLCGRNEAVVEQLLLNYPNVNSIELNSIPKNSICILCVSDSSIALISSELKDRECFLIHCSGAVSIDVLIPNGIGAAVIWPLQSFTELPVIWDYIPLIVEFSNEADGNLINWITSSLGGPVHYLDSDKRRHLHLAAVMVNNFSNYLFQTAQEYCVQENLPFETLKPLIQETVSRIGRGSMIDFQTGPAIRGDAETISKHLEILRNDDRAKSLYEFMSNEISKDKDK
jgi:predicted short-subunit dehydrogenase-like oxidoreductase (DUF2520 family)